MVNKLAPCLLCNLCPAFVNERSIAIAFVWEIRRPKGIGNLFFFHHLSCGIVFLLKFANPLLLVVLKIMFRSTWNFQLATICFTRDRVASIFHSSLRLNFSTLNHDLFKKNCSASSVCCLCSASVEGVILLLFLFCSSFATLRETLFSSAAHLLGDKWLLASDKKRIDFLLNGVPGLDFQINVNLFFLIMFCLFVWLFHPWRLIIQCKLR